MRQNEVREFAEKLKHERDEEHVAFTNYQKFSREAHALGLSTTGYRLSSIALQENNHAKILQRSIDYLMDKFNF